MNVQDQQRVDEIVDPYDHSNDPPNQADGEAPPGPSLTDDVMALLEDGKTYAEAELQFQKSRASYIANRTKGAVGFGLAAFGMFHLALIAATVGVVFALIPLVGAWGATAIVTLLYLLGGVGLLMLVKGRIDDIRNAFDKDPSA